MQFGGSDIVLTIDASLQEVAEKALKSNIESIKNGEFGTAYNATRWCNGSNECKKWRSTCNGKLSRL